MGLKVVRQNNGLLISSQIKSDHSGIESTALSILSGLFASLIKSDHSGIESIFESSSTYSSFEIKSDHSGIESSQILHADRARRR